MIYRSPPALVRAMWGLAVCLTLGLGGIGSVSLPFASTSEALVKVGRETIASEKFYDSFFDLVRRYMADNTSRGE